MQLEHQQIGDRAADALAQWDTILPLVLALGISPDALNGHTPGLTLSEVSQRVRASLIAVQRLKGVAESQLLLLGSRLQILRTAVDSIYSSSQQIEQVISPYRGGSAQDRNGNLSLALQHPETGSTTYDLGSPLSGLLGQTNNILDALPAIQLVAGETTVPVFSSLASAAEVNAGKVQQSANTAEELLASMRVFVAEIQKNREQATATLGTITDTASGAHAQKASTDTNAAEVEQKLVRVREISKDADTLQQKVTAFTSQFEAFEGAMKTRLEQFAAFEVATKEAEKKNLEREAEITRLIDRADTMIRGATTAGLSKSLDDAKDTYERRLQATQTYFILSVFALFVSGFPIAAQLIPGPWQAWMAPSAGGSVTDASPWLSTLGKFALLLPATWATAFFASNYAELFHLSREYAHKAALAKAIEGFKREAPNYEQEIVGSVFMEIQDNPRSRKASPAATPQNPIVKSFLKIVLEVIRGKQEEQK
jgi:hypothetical protein